MLKIGEFSRLTRVPAKTLRYYDEIDLFKPMHYNKENGYRYYSVEQLPRLYRIVALKGLGIALEQIKFLLNEDVSVEEIRGMLKMRQAEIAHKLEEERLRLMFLEAYMRQMENENGLVQYNVIIKPIEPIRVVSIRGIMPKLEQIGEIVADFRGALLDHLHAYNIVPDGAHFHIYHDIELQEENIDMEIAFPITSDIPDGERVKVRIVEGIEQVACAVHHGPFVNMLRANVAIMHWIAENGYHVAGPYREVYLQYQPQGDQQNCVTEVQFPISRTD